MALAELKPTQTSIERHVRARRESSEDAYSFSPVQNLKALRTHRAYSSENEEQNEEVNIPKFDLRILLKMFPVGFCRLGAN